MLDSNVSVLKLRGILFVTVPAEPGDDLINHLQQKILESMEQHEAKGLILDISTVSALDSFFARTIVETAQMVGLMGGRTVISGMRPEVAITATQLGLSLGNILTALNMDRALDMLEGLEEEEWDR